MNKKEIKRNRSRHVIAIAFACVIGVFLSSCTPKTLETNESRTGRAEAAATRTPRIRDTETPNSDENNETDTNNETHDEADDETDNETSVDYYKKLVELDPYNPNGYIDLSLAYVEQNSVDEAIDTLRDGTIKLPDDASFLNEAIKIFDNIININPKSADAYIGLAEVYTALADEEASLLSLERGIDNLPENATLTEYYYKSIMPVYDIQQTLYQELRGDDGKLIAYSEYNQPVFQGDSIRIQKMNEWFKQDTVGVTIDNVFGGLLEPYNDREHIYNDVQSGAFGENSMQWEESYRTERYISFICYQTWYSFGAHGGFETYGRTFDLRTGDLLELSDILSISPEDQVDILYNEYIAYQSGIDEYGEYLAELAQGYENGQWSDMSSQYWIDSVKEQCGENAVFCLADDGVNIFFHQYTFYYAVGASSLVIPYDRYDLLKDIFTA